MHSHTRLKPSLFTLSGLAYSLVSYVFFLLVFIYLMGFDATIGGLKGIVLALMYWLWQPVSITV